MAWVGLVVGQFHAMARHNTAEGKSDLRSWTTRVWSDPARDFFSPLLDWANADTVYMTYGKIWFPVFAAFTACAFVLYQRRRPTVREVRLAVRARRLRLGRRGRLRELLDPVDAAVPAELLTWSSCSWTSLRCCSAGSVPPCSGSA